MSTRQRSFFDQVQTSKARSYWRRHKSANDGLHETEHARKPEGMIAPLPVSSESRSKLRAFECLVPVEPAKTEGEKAREKEGDENASPNIEEGGDMVERGKDAMAKPEDQPPTHPPMSASPRDHPRTPASRIPLADLINNEEPASQRRQDISPEERVFWAHTRSPLSSASNACHVTPSHKSRKGTKRARSSSPTSSPQESLRCFSAEKGKIDCSNPQRQSEPTTNVDPATDLWNRYAPNVASDVNGSTDRLPSLANLLTTSSPRTHLSGLLTRTGATLRRSISCGTEWPTSNAKRRRITGPDSRESRLNALGSTRDRTSNRDTSKASRVSFLVEKIQESLTKPSAPTAIRNASSSSPLQENARYGSKTSTSVTGQAARQQLPVPECEDGKDGDTSAPQGPIDIPEPALKETSSDFGDFDEDALDMTMVDGIVEENAQILCDDQSSSEVDNIIAELQGQTESLGRGSKRGSFAGLDGEGEGVGEPQQQSGLKTDPDAAVQIDEFEDDDDDCFSADLEEVLVKYETQTGPLSDHSTRDDGLENPGEGCSISDDEFGESGDFDFELAAVDAEIQGRRHRTPKASQNASSQSHTRTRLRRIDRFSITRIFEGDYTTDQDFTGPEKILTVENEAKDLLKTVVLRQSWYDTPCTIGAFVHLIGNFSPQGQCVVDDSNNMLILHPDHLISSTVVADSFGCTRRAVLQDRVKATSEASEAQIFGHILHEIFQEALKANRWESQWLDNVIEKVVMRYIEGIYEINMGVDQAIQALKSKMPEMQSWAEAFVSAKPKAAGIVNDRNGKQSLLSINKLLDVEEHIWSPKYGLKGNIDATVQVVMDDEEGEKTLTVPFELKSGKHVTSTSHRAQTALYTLLLSDRYDIDVRYGILYYMGASNISRIPAIRHEIRHLIMKRNELACYVRNRVNLPPMLKNPHVCGSCYAKLPCFVYHKLVDDGNGETSGVHEKFQEVVKHVKPEHQTFFQHWDSLLTKEETDMLKFRPELWTMLSAEREMLGRCFAKVFIEAGSAHEDQDAPKINRFQYTFLKDRPASAFSFMDSQIAVGEPIVVSDELGHFALANGYVTRVRKRSITVGVDRRLHNARTRGKGFDAERNQVFAGIMEVMETTPKATTPTQRELGEKTLYRLDKDEFSNGMAVVRNNLIQVMSNEVIGSREIREFVVEKRAPIFNTYLTKDAVFAISSQASLNVDQRRAIEKVMGAQDYALVLGMPGTGKTTTIAHMIRTLVSQNKSVLLASYTHTAVDNILLKIRDDKIRILRLGSRAKINTEVQQFSTLACEPKSSVEELREVYHGPKVVATTCLGINHPIFRERVFDYCIVDEASQITLPVCLGPIRMAKRFVLVGDHNQLPPLVQNLEARKDGLDVSLFKLLSDRHPESVVILEHQYRMCEDIMTLSNTFIYDGLLKCGNDEVARRTLTIPNIEGLKTHHVDPLTIRPNSPSRSAAVCLRPQSRSCWLRDLVDPSTRACFVNTDALLPSSREIAKGSRIVNPVEAALCAQLVEALLSTGVSAKDIGVISVYRSQLAVLKQNLRHHPEVEMHTTDRFQGRDKEVVIMSLVRSNEAKNVGDLLKDWRRINVAFTRARTKLLILGSKQTMSNDPLLQTVLALMDKKQWIYDLPKDAPDMHCFDEHVDTQGTGPGGHKSRTSPTPSPLKKREAGHCKSLGSGGTKKKENLSSTGVRSAAKTGKVSNRAILGSRPVLQDIVNDLM